MTNRGWAGCSVEVLFCFIHEKLPPVSVLMLSGLVVVCVSSRMLSGGRASCRDDFVLSL